AGGGWIAVFTEDGSAEPIASLNGGGGNYDTYTVGAKLRGATQNAGYVVAGNEFDTQGHRQPASARGDRIHHPRLSRSLIGAPRRGQREVARRPDRGDAADPDRQLAISAGNAGPARLDTRASGSRPAAQRAVRGAC